MHQETAWLIGIFFLLCVALGYLMNVGKDLLETAERIEKLLEKNKPD
jgi:preprotein translocase subunit SecG